MAETLTCTVLTFPSEGSTTPPSPYGSEASVNDSRKSDCFDTTALEKLYAKALASTVPLYFSLKPRFANSEKRKL